MFNFAASQKANPLDPHNYGPRVDEFKEPRFLEQVKLFFDRAASKTDVPQEYLNVIKACNTVIRFNIPLRRDNGKIDTITCYRYLFTILLSLLNIELNTVTTDSQSRVVLDTQWKLISRYSFR